MIKCGTEPFLECSSKGDKRFSAFHARIIKRNNRSIEELYQAAKVFEDETYNKHWRDAKGQIPVNIDEVRAFYSKLWDEYIDENPNLVDELLKYEGTSDIFGQEGRACQAIELFRIRNERKDIITPQRKGRLDMSHVTILVSPQSYRIPVTVQGDLIGTKINVNVHCHKFVEMIYDKRFYKWIPNKKYRHYDKDAKLLYLPRYDLPRFEKLCVDNGVTYEIKELPRCQGKKISLQMQPWFKARDDRQASAITYLTVSPEEVRGLALQTGAGKTASSLAVISTLGVRAIIEVPSMVDQWTRAIYKFTKAKPEDVYIVQGMPSLAKLLAGIDKTLFPKIILVSIPTLRSYCNGGDTYVRFPPFDELCDRLNVGVRIVDEAHLNFHANLVIDLRLNAAVTIVMTATFDVSKSNVLSIFNGHYPMSIRHGEADYKKYIDIYAFDYRLGAGDIPSKVYQSSDGYNHAMFENWLLTKGKLKLRQMIDEVYYPIVNSLYVNKIQNKEKLLVLCSTVQMCEYLCKEFSREYPEFKCTIYVAETNDSVLDENDIIVSTPKSAGTGRDISNLHTMLTTVSVRASGLNKQMLGRLRELKDPPRTPIYAYCYCRSLPSQVSHAESREQLFKPLALNFYKYSL